MIVARCDKQTIKDGIHSRWSVKGREAKENKRSVKTLRTPLPRTATT